MYYIYTLSHPITKEIRYIGLTNNLSLRLNKHICPEGFTHKECWIRGLKKQGLRAVIEELDLYSTLQECREMEKYWISQFKAWGFRLLNLTPGGEGVQKPCSEKTKRKISTILREKYRNEIHPFTGRKLPQSTIDKMKEGYQNGIRKRVTGEKHPNYGKPANNKKGVIVYKMTFVEIDRVDSIAEASRKYNINPSSVSCCCNNKAGYAGDYKFQFIENL